MSKLVWVDGNINNPELQPDKEELIDRGHKLKCFSNITDFIKYFKIKEHNEEYDGIIIDLYLLPEKIFDMEESEYGSRTGLLLAEKVREIPNFKNSKIIIYSIVDSNYLSYKYKETDLHFLGKSELLSEEFVKEVESIINYNEDDEYKQIKQLEPFDIVIYKPTGERGLVKKVTENGVFVLFRIQSTAQLCKFEDLEIE